MPVNPVRDPPLGMSSVGIEGGRLRKPARWRSAPVPVGFGIRTFGGATTMVGLLDATADACRLPDVAASVTECGGDASAVRIGGCCCLAVERACEGTGDHVRDPGSLEGRDNLGEKVLLHLRIPRSPSVLEAVGEISVKNAEPGSMDLCLGQLRAS